MVERKSYLGNEGLKNFHGVPEIPSQQNRPIRIAKQMECGGETNKKLKIGFMKIPFKTTE